MPKLLRLQKQGLKDLAAKALEAELNQIYGELVEFVADWQEGKLSAADLNLQINRIQQGPVREIGNLHLGLTQEMRIARAIARGLMTVEDLPESVRPTISPHVIYYRQALKGSGADTVFDEA